MTRNARWIVIVAFCSALGCGGASRPAERLGARGGTEARSGDGACARTAEELAVALRAIASHDVPPAAPEDQLVEAEWTPALRAWNDLQSESLRAAEGTPVPGMVWRHRTWVHALRAKRTALEQGPFELEAPSATPAFFRAGGSDSSESLTVQVAVEDGCLRLDDR